MSKIGKKYYAGLLFLKSEAFASLSGNYFNEYSLRNNFNYIFDDQIISDYQYIRWFDENASISDIDSLINLTLNKHKKPFQIFFTDSVMGPTDVYRDLKGNMAFRKGDLILANKTYQEMNPHFWDSEYLQEDPFVPKYWPSKRIFNYKFSKLDFTNKMVQLTKQTKSQNNEQSAQSWLKLGHGYYNTTYWGNCWMVNQFSSSCSINPKNSDFSNPFYTCSKAKECYLNVVKLSKDKELIATAVFMIYACDYHFAEFCYSSIPWDKRKKTIFKTLWLKDFANKYKETKVYQEYLSNCSYLNEYMKKGYLVIGTD
jgi:hypothetical protein